MAAARRRELTLFHHTIHASEALRAELAQLERLLAEIEADRRAGKPWSTILVGRQTNGTRDGVYRSIEIFEKQFMALRSEGIRQMVDDEGLSHSHIAGVVGRSRQFIGRLYRSAHAAKPLAVATLVVTTCSELTATGLAL